MVVVVATHRHDVNISRQALVAFLPCQILCSCRRGGKGEDDGDNVSSVHDAILLLLIRIVGTLRLQRCAPAR